MNKNDISDALDFLDEDMVRHTEMLRRNWTQQEKKSGQKREWRSFGAAAAACLVLFFVLIALVVWINRRASAGQGEGGASVTEGMTAKEDGQSETEDMTVYNSEAEVSEASEEFVTIETLFKQLEQEEGAFTESGTLDTILSKVEIGDYVGLYELVFWSQSGDGVLSESMGS
ncbi:MAG: hypothetical protein LUH58_10860, partial [Lachnospiraceae bacterium]|nr:hypothetical protein [Lachnospiraceae bacterium]